MSSESINCIAYDAPRADNSQRVVANTPHNPIAINGDANFSATAMAEGWSGNGSLQDPYVIENFDFTLSGPIPEASINISDTRVHYIIQGCNLFGPAASPSYGIYVDNSTNGQIINNMVTNFANGLYVSSGCNGLYASNNNISYNSYGIYWSGSSYPNLTQNICTGNFFDGIYIEHSALGGSISENICNNNDRHGIFLNFDDSMMITENICNENSQNGFYLNSSQANWIENNTSIENNYAIFTYNSEVNDIYWNVFANSTTSNVDAQGPFTTFRYNFYSDYAGTDAGGDGIGDTSHLFSGYADISPLMFPPFPVEWVHPITDQHVEFGSEFQYSIAVICPAPYDLRINDSTNFWLDMEIIYSSTTLDIGDYPLAVNATNIYGYFTEGVFELSVRDTTPPIIITYQEDITFTVGDDSPELRWTMSDLSPLTFRLLRNGNEVTSNVIPTTTVGFSTFIENYEAGVFNYTVVAVDIWDNVATDMVIVTILPIPFIEAMLPLLIAGIVATVVVIVIVVIVVKRRSAKKE